MAGGQLDGLAASAGFMLRRDSSRIPDIHWIAASTSQWIATRMLHPPLNLLTPLVAELYIHRDRFTLPRSWGAPSQPLGSFTELMIWVMSHAPCAR